MNQTKQQILQGEVLLKNNKKFASDIAGATDTVLKEPLLYLFNERIANLESRLTKLRAQWAVEFEKESAEANSRMPALVANSMKYIGRQPSAVSDKIEAIVQKYETEQLTDQEEKNDAFYELIEHVRFFNTKVK